MSAGGVAAIVFAALLFAGGVYCMILYARSRKTSLLVAGLSLMFVVAGVLVLVALGVTGRPPSFETYGPPPTTRP